MLFRMRLSNLISFKRSFRSTLAITKDGRRSAGGVGRLKAKDSSGEDGTSDVSRNISALHKALNVIESSLGESGNSQSQKRVPVLKSFFRPLFPGFYKAITLTDEKLIQNIQKRLSQNKPYVGVFLSRLNEPGENQSGFASNISSPSEIHSVGSLCQIYNMLPGPNDTMTMLLFPHRRILLATSSSSETEIDETTTPVDTQDSSISSEYLTELDIEDFVDIPPNGNIMPLIQDVVDTLLEISLLNPLVKDQLNEFLRTIGIPPNVSLSAEKFKDVPAKLADFTASMCEADPASLQYIMDTANVENRLERASMLLQKELISSELQSEIRKDADRMISERDRTAFLKNRLKSIQRELGMEVLAKEKLLEKYESRMSELLIPQSIQKVIDEELAKLENLRPSSQEYHLATQYLDWLTQVPWGKHSKESLDIALAENVLDEDHYGLKDVKERILEFIAVGKMRGSVQGKILCLSGPPGVGKTSIGKSIARALNRNFYRFSVGGLYDVAEIKGHRRTYVGAMPGKLVQALKLVQTENPLILIDEVDKIGKGGHSGDPSAALLEVLDPEQNSSFVDHYMDIPMDLSKILFVCTANVLDTIPEPLLDRMEIVNLSGYVSKEKMEIAKRYLIPRAMKSCGLEKQPVTISDEALKLLLDGYCRESGVRNLKKHVERIFRVAAFRLVDSPEKFSEGQTINITNLKDYVGNRIFPDHRTFDTPQAGVICGLAYNAYGGSTLYIESIRENPKDDHGKGRFQQTGNMGNVMKESTQIAYSYAKHFASRLSGDGDGKSDYFKDSSIHLHVPEGAIPKDGPSAGIAMCSSLVSLALDKPPVMDVAMTGELTLTGRVLKIGGLKEKIMAARRSNIPNVVIPEDNRADFEILEDYIKDGLNVHFVKTFDDVFQVVFGGVTEK